MITPKPKETPDKSPASDHVRVYRSACILHRILLPILVLTGGHLLVLIPGTALGLWSRHRLILTTDPSSDGSKLVKITSLLEECTFYAVVAIETGIGAEE